MQRKKSTFACLVGSTRSNLSAAQVSDPLLPALCCLHDRYLEGDLAVHMLTQCTYLLVEKASIAPDVTLRFTACTQVCR